MEQLILRMAAHLYPNRASVTFSTALQDWIWNDGWPSGVSAEVVTVDILAGTVTGSLGAAGRRLAEEHTRRAIEQGSRISDDVLRWYTNGGPPPQSSDEREKGYVPDFARVKA